MSNTGMTGLGSLDNRQALGKLLDGRSDDEINQLMSVLGFDTMLEMVIPAMLERFKPSAGEGQTATVQFDVSDSEGNVHTFHIAVEDGSCSGAVGPAEAPRVTLVFPAPGFVRFLAGTVDPMQTFMSGEMKIQGDMLFAMTFQNWFSME